VLQPAPSEFAKSRNRPENVALLPDTLWPAGGTIFVGAAVLPNMLNMPTYICLCCMVPEAEAFLLNDTYILMFQEAKGAHYHDRLAAFS